MTINAAMISDLRSKTGLGIMKCKEALKSTNGDIDDAIVLLRKQGLADASKKSHRTTREGAVGSYIHHSGKLGVLVEVSCETDFVAKTDDFKEMVRNIAMHIASANPQILDRDAVPENILQKEREIYREQVAAMGKPENIVEKIVDGKMKKYFSQVCLVDQAYVKQDDLTIQEYLKSVIAKLGENMQLKRFVRLQLGEEE